MGEALTLGYLSEFSADRPVHLYRRFRPEHVKIQNGLIIPSDEDMERWNQQDAPSIVQQDDSDNVRAMLLSFVRIFQDFESPYCLTSNNVDGTVLNDETICSWCEKHGMPSNLPYYSADEFRLKSQTVMVALCGFCASSSNEKRYMAAAQNGIYPVLVRYAYSHIPDIQERERVVKFIGDSVQNMQNADETDRRQGLLELSCAAINNILIEAKPQIRYKYMPPYNANTVQAQLLLHTDDVFGAMAYTVACIILGNEKRFAICQGIGCGRLFEKKANRSKYCENCDRRTDFSRRQRTKGKEAPQ